MLLVSFCHGYQNEALELKKERIPALLTISPEECSVKDVFSFFFPRLHEDFYNPLIKKNLVGELPLENSPVSFPRLPRFGVTGLATDDSFVYCATWNGIYILNKAGLSVSSFLSHRLICDPHGIAVQDGLLFTVLTSLDLIVITDIKTGEIKDSFSIGRDLSITRDKQFFDFDWRFISKQCRGAVGNWHFNNVRVEGDKLYVTSRLTSSFVEIDWTKGHCELRTVCWDTPVMIHDGIRSDKGELLFTSVDGKVLICDFPERMESPLIRGLDRQAFHPLMKRDYVNQSIRLSAILGREVNWCRGICDNGNEWVTTIDGRYDQERPFFSVCFVPKDEPKQLRLLNIDYTLLDFSDEIRYMTGFDIEKY